MKIADVIFLVIMAWILSIFLVVKCDDEIAEVEVISTRSYCIDYSKEELLDLLQEGYCAGGKLEHLKVSIWHCKEAQDARK